MKIERISDNQIRCTLNKEDLEGKETLLSELAFGSEKAKGLFRELMNKAATELGFETSEDNPLMVEAIPVSKECLILVITRVDNPEDFREHYKKLPKSLLAGQLAGADEDILSDLPDLLSDFGKSAIAMMYFILFFAGGMTISVYEGLPLSSCLFEAASAVGTVGLTWIRN